MPAAYRRVDLQQADVRKPHGAGVALKGRFGLETIVLESPVEADKRPSSAAPGGRCDAVGRRCLAGAYSPIHCASCYSWAALVFLSMAHTKNAPTLTIACTRCHSASGTRGNVALCDRRENAGLWTDGRFNQIASLSSSNAVASRSAGAASTHNS